MSAASSGSDDTGAADAAGGGQRRLNVAMIGHSFMGAAHSQAWRTVGRVFDLPLTPRMRVVVGRRPEATSEAADRLGWEEAGTDWRAVVERDDIDLVDIVTPGDSHAEIALAALAAGKHVLCEKPLANTVAQARELAAAARSSDRVAMVGFNYRRVPALALARDLIAAGRIGTVRHVRAHYLQDWLVDPTFPLAWRLQAERAGSGALGDLGAHIVDLAEFLTGSAIRSVTGITETFVKQRPLPVGPDGGLSGVAGTELGQVTVDDAALFLARFDGPDAGPGAVGTFEATRFATGRKNGMGIEVNGSTGSVAFELETLNELLLFESGGEATTSGSRRILVTESAHPYLQAWWPPGHIIGWEHSFTHEMRDLVLAIAGGTAVHPDFTDGLRVQQVLQAVQDSAARGRWVDIAKEPG